MRRRLSTAAIDEVVSWWRCECAAWSLHRVDVFDDHRPTSRGLTFVGRNGRLTMGAVAFMADEHSIARELRARILAVGASRIGDVRILPAQVVT